MQDQKCTKMFNYVVLTSFLTEAIQLSNFYPCVLGGSAVTV